ncbi:hypothetical protein [Sandaracinus amylolyticus]|uniref:hypothetical protein n=1 Tax=Sandaracinus amylolyticus TaxID=927083 RepID=UPI001F30906A|nr:hypothetical protein [Sandaracinus amylolyticus]
MAVVALAVCVHSVTRDPVYVSPTHPSRLRVPSVEALSLDPYVEDGAALVVTMRDVSLGAAPPLLALSDGRFSPSDIQGGENGHLATRILDALAAERGGHRTLTLSIEPEVPFATVARVVYSAGQANRSHLRFAVRRGAEFGVLTIVLPPLSGSGVLSPVTSATVFAEGVIVARGELRYDGTCEGVSGRAVAAGRTAAGPDFLAVTRCLSRLRAAFPRDPSTLIVSADPDIPFGELASLIAVSRGSDSFPFYSRILISAGVR